MFGGKGKRKRESQGDPPLSTEPTLGLHPGTMRSGPEQKSSDSHFTKAPHEMLYKMQNDLTWNKILHGRVKTCPLCAVRISNFNSTGE